MAVETDADLRVFVHTSEFGMVATITLAAGGAPFQVDGILEDGSLEVDLVGGPAVVSSGPQLTCVSADVSAVVRGDLVVIGSTSYAVKEPEPDGTGMTVLRLVLA
ncbi:MAG: hypothetical protein ACE5FA_07305 [Dehalococcoidia bacterium]